MYELHAYLPDGILTSECPVQTARITNPMNGETKMEFRGHESVVEVVAFAPIAAYTAIRELGGLPVGEMTS